MDHSPMAGMAKGETSRPLTSAEVARRVSTQQRHEARGWACLEADVGPKADEPRLRDRISAAEPLILPPR